jgi:hypothetical protein
MPDEGRPNATPQAYLGSRRNPFRCYACVREARLPDGLHSTRRKPTLPPDRADRFPTKRLRFCKRGVTARDGIALVKSRSIPAPGLPVACIQVGRGRRFTRGIPASDRPLLQRNTRFVRVAAPMRLPDAGRLPGTGGRTLSWKPPNRLTNGSQFRNTTLSGSERSFQSRAQSPSTKV